jgi:hypothetical protein
LVYLMIVMKVKKSNKSEKSKEVVCKNNEEVVQN